MPFWNLDYIPIKTDKGPTIIEGVSTGDKRFSVHPAIGYTGYAVTHRKTGLLVVRLATRKEALAMGLELAGMDPGLWDFTDSSVTITDCLWGALSCEFKEAYRKCEAQNSGRGPAVGKRVTARGWYGTEAPQAPK